MSLQISKNIEKIKPSATLGMISKIDELKKQGNEIIAFNLGEPDFDSFESIVEAAKKALDDGHTRYVAVPGIESLRQAIAAKLKKDNNLVYEPNQIVVSTGGKQALFNSISILANLNDEFIIPTPCWVSYEEMVAAVGAKSIFVTTKDDFQLDLDEIEKAITNKTKAIIINTPNNPTGCVYTKESLRQLADLALKYQFYIICDEIYEKLIYNNEEHFSIASVNEQVYQQTITINGFSKAYAMTGYRVGYAAYPKHLVKYAINLQAHLTSNSTTPMQYAALDALLNNDDNVKFMVEEFSKRRDLSFKLLDEINNLKYVKVKGAFYIMLDVSYFFNKKYQDYLIKDADDMSLYLLNEAKIALVSGKAFCADNYLRFSYSNSTENIQKGLSALKMALAKLQ